MNHRTGRDPDDLHVSSSREADFQPCCSVIAQGCPQQDAHRQASKEGYAEASREPAARRT